MTHHPQKSSARPTDAAAFLAISVATLWRWSRERHDFPKPRRLSARCVVFSLDELAAWRDSQAIDR